MDINIITKDTEWDDVIERLHDSTIFHTSGWKRFLEKQGCKGFLIVAKDNDNIFGALPIYIRKSLFFRSKQFESIPFCWEKSFLINQKENKTLKSLLEGWKELASEYKVERTDFMVNNILDIETKVTPMRRYFFKTEGYTADYIWKNILGAQARRHVSRAFNKAVSISTVEDLSFFDEYYKMYTQVMNRQKNPLRASKNFFRDILEMLGKNVVVFVVEHNNKIIGTSINFHYNNILHNYSQVSDTSAYRYHPSDMQYWGAIKWATENNCRQVDFGCGPLGKHVGIANIKNRYCTNTEYTFFLKTLNSRRSIFENFVVLVSKEFFNFLSGKEVL